MVTCDKMDLIHFTPDVQAWDPYDESYADYKDIFLDFNGYLRNPWQAKKRRLIEEARMDPFRVTGEHYEAVIEVVFTANDIHFILDTEDQPQYTYDESFNLQDNQMQYQITDLSECFDPALFCVSLNSQNEVSKFGMATGYTTI